MKKKIQFSLVYRDMWQSSGKFQPRKDQLERIAPAIIDMGCFSRVETNGGAFEQVNLLAGENPNDAVRAFCKPFNELRMYPVPDDVRSLMYKVKHAQGVDIPRIFCGLNDVRNIIPSIKWALEAGMTPQATLCITTSPIHTVEYYSNIADQVIAAGATEICLKDMAGIGQPAMLGKLTKAIKTKHPDVIIQYHGHSGPGLSMASILEVCNNGGDVIDTAIEPLSWGKVHPDIISVQSMLKNEGFEVAEIDMNAYMRARTLTQEFIDEWLGYFINPGNKQMSSLLLGCGLPGGMMGSMMADLAGIHRSINSALKSKGQPELTTDELLVKLFDEVAYVWPRVGYPPLVTPFSQYVKNIALLNLLTMAQGKGRFVMMDDSMWGMILGKSGKIPGTIDPELVELAAKQGREFTDADPHTLIPNALDDFKKEMDENGWEYGKDDEELFEPTQQNGELTLELEKDVELTLALALVPQDGTLGFAVNAPDWDSSYGQIPVVISGTTEDGSKVEESVLASPGKTYSLANYEKGHYTFAVEKSALTQGTTVFSANTVSSEYDKRENIVATVDITIDKQATQALIEKKEQEEAEARAKAEAEARAKAEAEERARAEAEAEARAEAKAQAEQQRKEEQQRREDQARAHEQRIQEQAQARMQLPQVSQYAMNTLSMAAQEWLN